MTHLMGVKESSGGMTETRRKKGREGGREGRRDGCCGDRSNEVEERRWKYRQAGRQADRQTGWWMSTLFPLRH